MKKPSDGQDWDSLRERIIGLGERSFRKSYYPELSQKLGELERFRTIIDQANDFIFLVQQADQSIVDVNESACYHLGFARQEILSKSWKNLFLNAADISLSESADLAAPRRTLTTSLLKRDNTPLPVEITLKEVSFDGVLYLVAVARDITDRIRAAEESERLARAIDQTDEAVVITNPQGTLIYINPAFEKMTGYTREEILNKNAVFFESDSNLALFPQAIRTSIKEGEQRRGRFAFQRKDGTSFESETSLTLIRSRSGQILNHLLVIRNITTELMLEKRLRETQKLEALGTLAGGIAHDFNNILMPIIGYTELALKSLPANNTAAPNLERVLNCAEHAKDLIKQILTFSRKAEQERKPIRVLPIVEDALKLLKALLPKTIEVQKNFKLTDDTILADPTQFYQVIINLCNNAGQAMGTKGGTLHLSLTDVLLSDPSACRNLDIEPGAYLRMDVQDTGPGIPPEIMDRLFEPFFTTKTEKGGTGIGLAVVHGIVKSHGGAIAVQSTVGKGSIFSAYFPKTKPTKELAAPLKQETTPNGRERILYVDDEVSIAELGKKFLESLGYQVDIALNGPSALGILRDNPSRYDLLITDQTMPLMTGTELAQKLREFCPHLPIILCTGLCTMEAMESLMRAGVCELITKPMRLHDLGLIVRTTLDRK